MTILKISSKCKRCVIQWRAMSAISWLLQTMSNRNLINYLLSNRTVKNLSKLYYSQREYTQERATPLIWSKVVLISYCQVPIRMPRCCESSLYSRLFLCLIRMAWSEATTDVILSALTWTEDGRILQSYCIQQSTLLSTWPSNWQV